MGEDEHRIQMAYCFDSDNIDKVRRELDKGKCKCCECGKELKGHKLRIKSRSYGMGKMEQNLKCKCGICGCVNDVKMSKN